MWAHRGFSRNAKLSCYLTVQKVRSWVWPENFQKMCLKSNFRVTLVETTTATTTEIETEVRVLLHPKALLHLLRMRRDCTKPSIAQVSSEMCTSSKGENVGVFKGCY